MVEIELDGKKVSVPEGSVVMHAADAAGTHYFGNSLIVTPIAEVVARAASHQCWISARLDPAAALSQLTPGSSVPQPFDHLHHRNLAFLRAHAEELAAPARAAFEWGGGAG